MSCIGIFDSGLGGLTIWRELQHQAPDINCLYLADQAHLPYGPRSEAEIRNFCEQITLAMRDAGAELIVLACNTASAAALHHLREHYPEQAFVGMEPAVKPAALHTQTGIVGLMATEGTLRGKLLKNTSDQFAGDVEIISSACPGLAQAIEAQATEDELLDQLREHLAPMVNAGADTVVLGCTHYPLISKQISQVLGAETRLIDPSAAVARQVLRLWPKPRRTQRSEHRFASTGDAQRLGRFLQAQWNYSAKVESWHWHGGKLKPSFRDTLSQ